jgi:hypothetical protein
MFDDTASRQPLSSTFVAYLMIEGRATTTIILLAPFKLQSLSKNIQLVNSSGSQEATSLSVDIKYLNKSPATSQIPMHCNASPNTSAATQLPPPL